MDDFSNHPPSITEVRAERNEDGTLWTPRDVLIATLRRIDNGENVDALIVAWRTKHECGHHTGHFFQAMQDPFVTMGLIANTMYKMQAPQDE